MDAAIQVQVNVIMFLNNLRAYGYDPPWTETKLNFTSHSDSTLQGNLNFTDFHITGFDTLTYDYATGVKVTQQTDSSFKICLNDILIDDLEFGIKYAADMGLDNETPFYGNGEFTTKIKSIDFTMCTILNPEKTSVSDLELKIEYRHHPVTVTGLFQSDEFSGLISQLLSISHRLYAMWNLYESDCSSCILNPFFQYFVNAQIGDMDPGSPPKIDCSCLEDIQNTVYGELLTYLENDEMRQFILLLLRKIGAAFSPT